MWESRAIIGKISKASTVKATVTYLLVDSLFTVAIFTMTASFFPAILDIVRQEFSQLPGVYRDLVSSGAIIFKGDVPFIDIFVLFFYTTLFTSVWVWLFMLGGILWPVFSWMRVVLRADTHPIGAAMTIGGFFFGSFVAVTGYIV